MDAAGKGAAIDATWKATQKSCYGVSSFLLRFDDGVSVGGELRRRVSAARQTGDGGNARGMRWRGRPPCFSVQMREVRRTMRKETDRTVTCAGIEGLRGDRRLSPAFQDGDLILFESPAISRYVLRKGASDLLQESNLAESATVDAWVEAVGSCLRCVMKRVVCTLWHIS